MDNQQLRLLIILRNIIIVKFIDYPKGVHIVDKCGSARNLVNNIDYGKI